MYLGSKESVQHEEESLLINLHHDADDENIIFFSINHGDGYNEIFFNNQNNIIFLIMMVLTNLYFHFHLLC